ncbi:MarR family winged helix-turn-helix transcriptional regulator [Limosilactobacillus sp.]|jgi:DNA-binding MarR family transcriptional regulator|uniref:MarR family winged helix-turn-helix transcriptional regulator n=1 Tax=Limosilactobacillus sp. TaxID=2773925 RepID=UPI0025B8CC96|nr:MarR family transcriptional regulator [Limosilactobacillus sp.]MCH3921865.1 MarR family transcriptional regulator [Limosilactobacillus sp.]MCH3928636.1 MarR family transcriptional regulator [Limosilactobacillus sp.]
MLSEQQINEVRAFNRHYTQVLGVLNKRTFDTKLTWPEGRILLEIGINHLSTPMMVANRLQLDKSYASRTIKRLTDKGLIAKTPSPTDSRSVNIALTDKGQVVCDDINQKSNLLIEGLISDLSEEEQERYFKCIMTINQLLFK